MDFLAKFVMNKEAQNILNQAIYRKDKYRTSAHSGYTQNIMKNLFPKSQYADKISDDLINKKKI